MASTGNPDMLIEPEKSFMMDENMETVPLQKNRAGVVWALIITVIVVVLIVIKLFTTYPTEPLAPGPVAPTLSVDVS